MVKGVPVMIDRAQEFTAHLRGTLGQDLRAVAVFGPDLSQQLFLREDLQGHYDSEEVAALIRKARSVGEPLRDVGSWATAMGDIQASVHVFDNALLVQFVLGPETGIIVSVEPDVGRALVEFIRDSRDRLGDF